MNKRVLTIVAIIGVGLLAVYGFKGTTTGAAGAWEKSIIWTDPGTTKAVLAADQKPVFVFIQTDWCTFCRKMEAETFADPQVQKELNERFVNITFNPEKEGIARFTGEELTYAALAEKLGVSGYPASFFYMPDGTLLGGQAGYIEPALFADLAAYIGGGYYAKYKFPEFQQLPQDQRTL